MDIERFTVLLKGPLNGPLPIMTISRLALALWAVLKQTGAAGAQALEEYCREREARDRDAVGE